MAQPFNLDALLGKKPPIESYLSPQDNLMLASQEVAPASNPLDPALRSQDAADAPQAPSPGALGMPPQGLGGGPMFAPNPTKKALYTRLMAQLNDPNTEAQTNAKQSVADYKQKLDDYMNRDKSALTHMNLSPFLALTDALTGSKMAQSYDPNQNQAAAQDAKAQQELGLQGQLASKESDLAKDERERTKDQLNALIGADKAEHDPSSMLMSQMFAEKRLQARKEMAASSAIDKDPLLNQYVPRLDGASRILGLISAVKSGDVKGTQQVLEQLNNEQARLESGSKQVGERTIEGQSMHDTAAWLHNKLDTVSGDVTAVNMAQKLAQAKAIIQEMGASYMNQIDDRYEGTLKPSAMPEQQPIFERVQKATQAKYGRRFGGWGDAARGQAGTVPGGAPPPHGNTVTQGGHTYTWNPATGKYE